VDIGYVTSGNRAELQHLGLYMGQHDNEVQVSSLIKLWLVNVPFLFYVEFNFIMKIRLMFSIKMLDDCQ